MLYVVFKIFISFLFKLVYVSIELLILGKPSPYLSLNPNQAIAEQRQDIICSISVLDADSDIRWYDEEGIITNNSRVTIFNSSFDLTINSTFTVTVITTTIQFNPILKTDEGNYSCYYSGINETEISTPIQLMVTSKLCM